MKQSSVCRAAWEKGFSSATRETAMFPAPLETCHNTAGRLDKALPAPLQLHGDSPKLKEGKGNRFECIGCFRQYCFTNRIPLTQQQYDKNITLTLKISSTSRKATGTKERLKERFKMVNILHAQAAKKYLLKQTNCTQELVGAALVTVSRLPCIKWV